MNYPLGIMRHPPLLVAVSLGLYALAVPAPAFVQTLAARVTTTPPPANPSKATARDLAIVDRRYLRD